MWALLFEKLSPRDPGTELVPAEVPQEAMVKKPYPKPSWLRRWLGDDYALYVLCSRSNMSEEELVRVNRAFPEAFIQLTPNIPSGTLVLVPGS